MALCDVAVAADQRRVAERRPRRRLGRRLVPRGGRPGGRVRPERRRPPRPRRVGLRALAVALPAGGRRLHPPPARRPRAPAGRAARRRRGHGLSPQEPVPNVGPRAAQARRAGRARDRAARRRQRVRGRLPAGGLDHQHDREGGSCADRDPRDRPRAGRRGADADDPRLRPALRGQEARPQAALGHDHPRPPRPRQGGDRGDVGAARPQGQDPRPRHGQDQRRVRARRPAPDGQDGQEAVREARPAVQDQPRRQRELRRLPQGRQLHRRRLRRHRPPLLQRQHAAARTTRRSTSTPATRSSRGATRSTTSATATATTTSCARRASRTSCASSRNAAGARQAAQVQPRTELARLFARYTDTDKGLRQKKEVFSLLKLVLFTGQKPVREVRFRVDLNNDPVYLTASPGQARQDRRRVPAREGVEEAAPDHARLRRATASRRRRARASATSAPTCPGSRSRAARARTRRSSAPAARDFPFYFPTLRYRGSRYAGTEPRHLQRSRTSAARSTARTGSWSPRASSASTTASRA